MNGYQTILYRYEEEPITGRKFGYWNYNSQSNIGPPDRHRSKYSTEEAIEQLHNVDKIFPYYENYFNITASENASSVREIITERVNNIEGKLKLLGNGSSMLKLDLNVLTFLIFLICGDSFSLSST